MDKYIELIDKYRIEQGEGDYNPPSYVWVDNTGEIVRCGECKHYNAGFECLAEGYGIERDPDWFCAAGERKVQDADKKSYDLTQGQMGILSEAIDMIDEQPTIVPAERSET